MSEFHTHSLSDQVTTALRQRLAQREWRLGDRLPGQNTLAAEMKVSVVVVREALARLKAEGLVESRQGAGVFVTAAVDAPQAFRVAALTEGDRRRLTEVLEVRCTIEVAAAELAARRRDGDDVLALTEAFKRLKAALAEGGDAIDEDFEFHLAIARATHNEFYPDLLRYLHQVLLQAIRTSRKQTRTMPGRLQQVQSEHTGILDAVVEGRAEAAGRMMQHHLTHAAQRLGLVLSGAVATSDQTAPA